MSIVPLVADEWGSDDDLWLDAAGRVEDPDGAVQFVRQYLEYFRDDRLDDAAAVLDSDYESHMPQFDLTELLGPGWGVAGYARLASEGGEIVRFVAIDVTKGAVIVPHGTEARGVDFVVRRGPEGWRLLRIIPRLGP
jgi:hypothetical protein